MYVFTYLDKDIETEIAAEWPICLLLLQDQANIKLLLFKRQRECVIYQIISSKISFNSKYVLNIPRAMRYSRLITHHHAAPSVRDHTLQAALAPPITIPAVCASWLIVFVSGPTTARSSHILAAPPRELIKLVCLCIAVLSRISTFCTDWSSTVQFSLLFLSKCVA